MKKYRVLVFSNVPAHANPCDIYVCEQQPAVDLMQSAAASSALSEVGFIYPEHNHHILRIFSPKCEMQSCLHATLAAHFVFNKKRLNEFSDGLLFQQQKTNAVYTANKISLPVTCLTSAQIFNKFEGQLPSFLSSCVSSWAATTASGRLRLMVELANEQQVKHLQPEVFNSVSHDNPMLESFFIYSALDDSGSYAGRMFAPALGISEDPVNGNSCIALFSKLRLDDEKLTAIKVKQNEGAWVEINLLNTQAFVTAYCSIEHEYLFNAEISA
ncbi:PhzF family phenazine biosynthesis isomerase [Neptunicella marina]|uniref:PhzF family phenazine biosynthesis protein n=1 Tax=Neptunicella marina TaxID=2125989 RepID=A0A8J6ITS4_9ALTE|nr:PhzF family phenazine biosynthesis isomerase [Neptunicella marina]MBC3765283.1 PhzF family phenazine biosynthesis protein [Neptunicella marina]